MSRFVRRASASAAVKFTASSFCSSPEQRAQAFAQGGQPAGQLRADFDGRQLPDQAAVLHERERHSG